MNNTYSLHKKNPQSIHYIGLKYITKFIIK